MYNEMRNERARGEYLSGVVNLLADLFAGFIRIGVEEIETAITSSLKQMGECAGVDRSYVYQFRDSNSVLEKTHRWSSDTVVPGIHDLDNISFRKFPWMMKRLTGGEIIRIDDVTVMHKEAEAESRAFEKDRIGSILIVPFHMGGALRGCVGFDTIVRTRSWVDDDISLLRIFSSAVGGALERRRSGEAIREGEEKFRTISESAADAIVMINNEGKIIYWNTTAERVFGYTAEEARGREIHELIAPAKFHNAYQQGFDIFRATGEGAVVGRTFELSAMRKDGTEFPMEISISAISIRGMWHATAIIRDITDRRVMEESLFEEKRFAENLLENSAVATFVLDPQHKVVLWNKACEELTGLRSDEVIGTDIQWKPFYQQRRQTLADVVIDGNPEILSDLYEKHARSTLISNGLHAEGWYQSLNRKKRYILFDAAPIFNTRGELTYVIETLQDITPRKLAEEQLDTYRTQLENLVEERTTELRKTNELLEQDIADRMKTEDALRRSEARFEEAQRVARLGTWEWNMQTDEVYWSDEVYRIFGSERGKIVPRRWTFLEYIYTEDRERVKEAVLSSLNGNSPYNVEARALRADGTVITVQSQGKVYRDKNGIPRMMLGNVQDITERKKMEEEVWKLHKLESMGVLAGGIAHDFNNLLSAILGNISLARLQAAPGHQIGERLKEAEKVIRRTKGLSQQLLTFSKGGDPVKKVVSLTELVKDSAEFALMGANIRAVYTLPQDLCPAEVDEGQIGQVINNIVINAKQAMQEGGKLHICGENVMVDSQTPLPLMEGKYVKISIRDEGAGIPEGQREKIFDPYYSTKQTGSGLGLAISFSIIKKHKGYLSVDSKVGSGTTFSIYLPASEMQIQKKGETEKKVIRGSGKVLVMDDDDLILLIIDDMLREIGYEAVAVENGDLAIEQYAQALEAGHPFDAVIMDLTVKGGMGGAECISKLLAIDPAVKAIVSSGYSDDPVLSDYRRIGFKGIITKPYQMEDLSEILFDVIHSGEAQ